MRFILLVSFLMICTVSYSVKNDPIEKNIVAGNVITADLSKVSSERLWIYRNMIFARHGKKFNAQKLNGLFYNSNQYGFKINKSYSDSLLTETDKKNISLIRKYEKQKHPKTILQNISLPATVKQFQALFGVQDKIVYPGDEPSPWGQWITWKNIAGNYSLTVLADNYTQTFKTDANVRHYIISALPGKKVLITDNLVLNKTTRNEIESLYKNCNLQKSDRFDLKCYENNLWTYFTFKNNKLTKVAQGTVDFDLAG